MTPEDVPPGGGREQIARAALELFAERGFAATGIADIRSRSGASTGSIYHHFGGKVEIAAALYADGLADYQAGLVRALRRNPSAEAGTRAMVRHHLRWVRRNRPMATFLLAGRDVGVRQASQGRVEELNRTVFAEMTAWHRSHTESGALRDLPFDIFFAAVIGSAQDFARRWLAGGAETGIDRAERDLAGTAWAAVCSEAPPT